MSNVYNFLEVLFDDGQVTCYTDTPYGYKLKSEPAPSDLFFCINALHPSLDLNPTKDWHNRNQPRRADCNVVCYRNFLIEIDNMELDKQIDYVKSLVPVSTIVYSGSSSYHFIISLEAPLLDYQSYMNLSKRIQLLVKEADPACKNPSRLSRLPDSTRPDTNKEQSLVYVGSRISVNALESILPILKEPIYNKPLMDIDKRSFITPLLISAVVNPDEMMQLRGLSGRNQFFYWLGCRMAELDKPNDARVHYVELAYNNLISTTGFSLEEAMIAARVKGE